MSADTTQSGGNPYRAPSCIASWKDQDTREMHAQAYDRAGAVIEDAIRKAWPIKRLAAEIADAGDRLAAAEAEHARNRDIANAAMDQALAPARAKQQERWAAEETAQVQLGRAAA